MWQKNHCSAYAVQLRNTPWVQTILRKMKCPPRPFDLWSAPAPAESSVQRPGFNLKQTPDAKKMPRPKAKVELPFKKKATAQARPAETSSSSSGAAVPSVPHQAPAEPGESASSSSSAAVSSVQRDIPWPCTHCRQMPWRCRCHCAEDRTPEHIQQDYELMCKRAGVWEAAEAQQGEADQKAAQPEPPEEHPPRDLWSCSRCSTMNTRHDLVCCVASCGARRPLVRWRGDKGDWICPECQNHNWGCRRWCNWTACPTNDWRCRCGNLNRSNRKFCNRFVCGLPRPFDYA